MSTENTLRRDPRLANRIISVSGSPFERGYEHGRRAKEGIKKNLQFYLNLWKYSSGLDRDQILKKAKAFIPYIENAGLDLIEELQGVAEGSGRNFDEIIALNSRYELSSALIKAQKGPSEGCTAYGLTPEATQDRHMFVGENWDYKPGIKNSCVILQINQEKKPSIILHTEAGIIGHKGFNSAGLGICLNFLQCDKDVFQPGLPVLIKIRCMLNTESLPDCLDILKSSKITNSVNIIIAHRKGEAIDVECAPGGTFFLYPERGILTHSNHFLSSSFRANDVIRGLLADTVARNRRASQLFREKSGELQYNTIQDVLKDHFGYPDSICRHQNRSLHLNDRWETLTSMIINLTEGKMLFTNGPPCSNKYETIAMEIG